MPNPSALALVPAHSTDAASLLSELVLVGEQELDEPLVEEAVLAINAIVHAKEVETARLVAQYVLDRFFGGSLEAYQARAEGHVTLRRLTQDPRLRFSRARLGASLQVLGQLRQLPDELGNALTFTHHKTLLPVGDLATKVELARQVCADGLSTRELQARIDALKPARPPRRPAVDEGVEALVTEIDRVIDAVDGLRQRLRAPSTRTLKAGYRARLWDRLEAAIEKLDAVADALRPLEADCA